MKRAIILLVIAFMCIFHISFAYAKREINSADYKSAGEFLADIETGTKVTFDAYLFKIEPYVDEDTFSMSYVLLPYNGITYNPGMDIYATEEDLNGIYASVSGEEKTTHYVRVTGIAEASAKNDIVFVSIMDGQGSIEIIEPEAIVYCADELKDIKDFKEKAFNYLDKIEIKNGTVIQTDDSKSKYNSYKVWVSCGKCTIQFQTNEKKFYVDDNITGIGLYQKVSDDGSIIINGKDLMLLQ